MSRRQRIPTTVKTSTLSNIERRAIQRDRRPVAGNEPLYTYQDIKAMGIFPKRLDRDEAKIACEDAYDWTMDKYPDNRFWNPQGGVMGRGAGRYTMEAWEYAISQI